VLPLPFLQDADVPPHYQTTLSDMYTLLLQLLL
jgi:hypothetical protein